MDLNIPNTTLESILPLNDSIPPTSSNINTMHPAPVVPYAKPFPDISKIEMFCGQNYKRWQERVYSVFDMHGVATALTHLKPDSTVDPTQLEMWTYANKVCRHTIVSTLTNEWFYVYCSYKEVKEI